MHIPSLAKIHWNLLKLMSLEMKIWTDRHRTNGRPKWNHNTPPLTIFCHYHVAGYKKYWYFSDFSMKTCYKYSLEKPPRVLMTGWPHIFSNQIPWFFPDLIWFSLIKNLNIIAMAPTFRSHILIQMLSSDMFIHNAVTIFLIKWKFF